MLAIKSSSWTRWKAVSWEESTSVASAAPASLSWGESHSAPGVESNDLAAVWKLSGSNSPVSRSVSSRPSMGKQTARSSSCTTLLSSVDCCLTYLPSSAKAMRSAGSSAEGIKRRLSSTLPSGISYPTAKTSPLCRLISATVLLTTTRTVSVSFEEHNPCITSHPLVISGGVRQKN